MRHWKMLASRGRGVAGGRLRLVPVRLPRAAPARPARATALTWHLYPDYLRALHLPQVRPYASRIRVAGGLGFGAPLLLLAMVLVGAASARAALAAWRCALRQRPRPAPTGPVPRAATASCSVATAEKLLRLGGQQSVLLAAPTRSGKGVGVVVPNLLDYAESVVVLDIKQENFELTSGWRQQQGHAVFLFNPFADDRRTHRWNPLTYVSSDPALRVSDLMGIAALLYPDGRPEQAFWTSHARNAFMAFALYLFDNRDDASARLSGHARRADAWARCTGSPPATAATSVRERVERMSRAAIPAGRHAHRVREPAGAGGRHLRLGAGHVQGAAQSVAQSDPRRRDERRRLPADGPAPAAHERSTSASSRTGSPKGA